MTNHYNITKQSAAVLLALCLFLLPLTSGYVTLNCDLRQTAGMSCCSSSGSCCGTHAVIDMPSFQAEPCCPCGNNTDVAPATLPDIDVLAKFSPLYPYCIEYFVQPTYGLFNDFNAHGVTETIAESPPGTLDDHLSLCHRLNI